MASTLTKNELVTEVALKTGSTSAQVHRTVQAILEVVQEALANGRKVELRNFGVFRPVERAAHQGRNPRDVTKVCMVPARHGVKFRVGAHLDKALNEPMVREVLSQPGLTVSVVTPPGNANQA